MIEDGAAGTAEQEASELTDGDRLSLGVAARLSRYLQVLTQARKMGKDTISSQELSDYTHINSTQIRRDLSGFGKFGKRGVGYNVDSLVREIRKILRTAGQHNIALFGAGHLGQAIASSDIFADHGFRIVAMFDIDPTVIGRRVGGLEVRSFDEIDSGSGRQAGQGGSEDHLQLLRAAPAGPPRRHGPHVEPGGGPPLRPLLLFDLERIPAGDHGSGARARRARPRGGSRRL
jgi:hypothetical protein